MLDKNLNLLHRYKFIDIKKYRFSTEVCQEILKQYRHQKRELEVIDNLQKTH